MQQHLVLHFSIVKNERVYQLLLQPGSPYEELQEVLEQFKVDFHDLQQQAIEKQKEAAEKEAAEKSNEAAEEASSN